MKHQLQKSLEEIDACPICSHQLTREYITCKDYSVSEESFTIVQCLNCTFIYTNPRPNEQQIGKYYQSNQYISHSDTTTGLISKLYHIVRRQTLQNKLQIVNSLRNKGKLLDIGAGTGAFLQVCEENGWQVKGIEPDNKARNIAKNKVTGIVEENILTSFENDFFNVITLWHVLEHVHKVNEVITKIKKILAAQGKLVVAVPNINSYDANYFKEYWAAYDQPRHLYHFSKETITLLMKKHGMKLEAIIPMKYDAYYIGLLSTQYKNSRINYIQGFAQGLKSNIWAKKHENNYSSLTYIFSN